MIALQSLRDYADHVLDGTAAVFVGAGASTALPGSDSMSGLPAWTSLTNAFARELNIDPALLPGPTWVADIYASMKGSTHLNRKLKTYLNISGRQVPLSISAITQLPVNHIWTTNFDGFLEKSLTERNIPFEKAASDSELIQLSRGPRFLYKMHGSLDSDMTSLVFTKEQYDFFEATHPLLRQQLTAQLATRHFLFVGFSLRDPNFEQILALLRRSAGNLAPSHFAIMKEPAANADEREKTTFKAYTQMMKKAYGIEVVPVTAFEDVPLRLQRISQLVKSRNVLVSGSLPLPESFTDKSPANYDTIMQIARCIGMLLAGRQPQHESDTARNIPVQRRKLISSFGLSIGPAVFSGFMEEVQRQDLDDYSRWLDVRPFPLEVPDSQRTLVFDKHRSDLVQQAGIVIYLGGRKLVGSLLVVADGVMKEDDIAKQMGLLRIPVSSTGGAAAEIGKRIREEAWFARLPERVLTCYEVLNDPIASLDSIVTSVSNILWWWDSTHETDLTLEGRISRLCKR